MSIVFRKIIVCGLFSVISNTYSQPASLDPIEEQIKSVTSELSSGQTFDYYSELLSSGIPPSSVSFYVQAVNQGAPLVNINANRAQNPASVIKLVTSFAALKTFGADYRWRTQLLSKENSDEKGVLHGPVYLKGSGDPQLVIEKVEELTKNLLTSGVKKLDGPIVIDRSIFKDELQDASSFDGEPSMPYNAQSDAALMNYRALTFKFDPVTRQVNLIPLLKGYHISKKLQWIEGACPSNGWKSTLLLNVSRTQANIGGKYYSDCGPQGWHFHAHEMTANDYAKGIFGGLMSISSGWARRYSPLYLMEKLINSKIDSSNETIPEWAGSDVVDGQTPSDAHVLATVDSAPLKDILRDMNHYSNNVMARQIYLGLSAKENMIGTLDASELIVRQRLAESGLHLNSLQMGNGSGLSRTTAISASDLGQMLVKASNESVFVGSLARLGMEGTVKNRLTDTDMVGRALLKTGSLNDIRAIAGYVDGKSGTRYVVVSIIQDVNAQTAVAKRIHDLFLQWVGSL